MSYANSLTLDTPMDFAFSPRLTAEMHLKLVIIPSAWKSIPRPLIIVHYFKLLDERVQRNSHQLKHNAHVIELFVLGPL